MPEAAGVQMAGGYDGPVDAWIGRRGATSTAAETTAETTRKGIIFPRGELFGASQSERAAAPPRRPDLGPKVYLVWPMCGLQRFSIQYLPRL